MLELGVVIPTKNSMKYLPGHLENLNTWIDLAEQVVVVDSFSEDGTVEFIKKTLQHPKLIFVTHPPGLYASWNFGIRQLTTRHCYISTVGDSLTRAGAEHLVATAERLDSDVLVSRPNFITEAGELCAGAKWPMEDIVNTLRLAEPCLFPSAMIVAAALKHLRSAITGSCASCLYRTYVLQQFPFPLDFGLAGDGAWCLQNAGRLKWAATPDKFTSFRIHPPTATVREIKQTQTFERYTEMANRMLKEWRETASTEFSRPLISQVEQLLCLTVDLEKSTKQYTAFRKASWPWILSPAAWQTRNRRKKTRSEINRLMTAIFREALS